MTIQEFKKKYGTKTLGLFVEKFLEHTSKFEGDTRLACELGIIMADLEDALENVK